MRERSGFKANITLFTTLLEDAILANATFMRHEVHVYTAGTSYSSRHFPLVYAAPHGVINGPPVLLAYQEPGHYLAVRPNILTCNYILGNN